MNFTYLKSHEDFMNFVNRLYTTEMLADGCGIISRKLSELKQDSWFIEVLRGDLKRYEEDDNSSVEDISKILSYGPFKSEPTSYPAVAIWFFETGWSSSESLEEEILEFVSIPELEEASELTDHITYSVFREGVKEEI